MASSELPVDMMAKVSSLENHHHQPMDSHPEYPPRHSVTDTGYSASMMPSFPTPLYVPNNSSQHHAPSYASATPHDYKDDYHRTSSNSSSCAMARTDSDAHNLDNLDRSLKSLIQAQASQNGSSGSESDSSGEDSSSQTPQAKQFDPIRNLMPMRQHTKWTLQQQKRNLELMNAQQGALTDADQSTQELNQSAAESGMPIQPEPNRGLPESSGPAHHTSMPPTVEETGGDVAYNRAFVREPSNVTDNHIEALVNEYFAGRNPLAPTNSEVDQDDDEGSSQQGEALSDADNESDIREEDLEEEMALEGAVEGADDNGQSLACDDCLQVFRSRTLLIYHQRKNWHGGLEPYMCPECGQEFGVKSHLRSHMATHSSIKPFQCPVKGCERTFARVDQVNNHLRLRHRTLCKVRRKDYYQGMPMVEAPLNSSGSEKSSANKSGNSADIACEDCGKTFKNRTLFYYHQHKNGHGGKVPYMCTVCSATFGVRTHLKLHMRKHTKERPFQCPMPHCGRFFSRIDAVNIHLKNVHNNATRVGAKDYRNIPVNNVFPVMGPLTLPMSQQHMAMIPPDPQRDGQGGSYACSDCEASYKTKALLDYHQRKLRHGGMQPFTCPICGAGFGHRSHLRGHLRKHTRARPFFCPVPGCAKRFSRVDIVNVHLKRVHKETLKVTMKHYVGLDLDGPDGKAIMRTTQIGLPPLTPVKTEDGFMSHLSPGENANPTENTIGVPGTDGGGGGTNDSFGNTTGMNMLLPAALNNVTLQLPGPTILSSLGMRPSMPPSSQANYMCNLCQKPFTDLISLQAHMRQHGTPKLYLCPVPGCGKYLSRVGIVNNHLQAIHGLNVRVSAWDYKSQRIPMFDPAKQMNAGPPGQQQQQQIMQNNVPAGGGFVSSVIGGAGGGGGLGLDKNSVDPLLFSPNHPEHSTFNMMNRHANLLALPPERFTILGSKFHRKFALASGHLDNVTVTRKRRAKMTLKAKGLWCRCKQCSYQTSTKTMMILHQRHHKGLNKYRCRHCNANYQLRTLYYRHVIKCASRFQVGNSPNKSHRSVNEQNVSSADTHRSSPKLMPFSPLHHTRKQALASDHVVNSKYFNANSHHSERMSNMHHHHQHQQHPAPSQASLMANNHQSVICSPPANRNSGIHQQQGNNEHPSDRGNLFPDHTRMIPPTSLSTAAPSSTSDLTSTYLKMLQFESGKNSTAKNSSVAQGQLPNHSVYSSHGAQMPSAGPFLSGVQNASGLLGGMQASAGHQAGAIAGMPEFPAMSQDQMPKQQAAPLPNIEAVAKYIKDRLPTASMYASVAQTILSCTQTYANNTPSSESNSHQLANTQVTYVNKNSAAVDGAGTSQMKAAHSSDVYPSNHDSMGTAAANLSGHVGVVTNAFGHMDHRPGDEASETRMSSNAPPGGMSHHSPGSSSIFTGLKDGHQQQQPPYLSMEENKTQQSDGGFPSPKLPSFNQIKSEPLPGSSSMPSWGLSGLGVGGMGMAASMYQNLMYPMLAAAAWGNTPYSQPPTSSSSGENLSDRNSATHSGQGGGSGGGTGTQNSEATYKCHDCGEAFRTKPLLVYHQRKNNHGGLHGFTCSDCGATFGTRCHLESHSRKHTKERPFTCPLCSSAYSRVDIVNVHLKTVHRSPLKVRASDYTRSKFHADI